MSSSHLAEVVESSTAEFAAECRDLHTVPAFGSLVKIKGRYNSYGLVYEASIRGLEPNRRATAFGLTPEQLAEEQPQIFELLRSEVRAFLVGYEEGGKLRQITPPEPPSIHAFVYPCSHEEIRVFASQTYFLRSLFTSTRGPVDELIIATLRYMARAYDNPTPYLVQAGRELAKLMRDDYDRLHSLMGRVTQ